MGKIPKIAQPIIDPDHWGQPPEYRVLPWDVICKNIAELYWRLVMVEYQK